MDSDKNKRKGERNKENRQYLKREENIEYKSAQVRENVFGDGEMRKKERAVKKEEGTRV